MNNPFKRALRIVALLAATLGLMLAFTNPASASADGPETCYGGACVWFKSYGDIIYVEDTSSNGYSAVAQVYVPGLISDNLWNSQGYGAVDSYKYGGGPRDIPEGTTVYYRACKGTTPLDCNPAGWTHGTA